MLSTPVGLAVSLSGLGAAIAAALAATYDVTDSDAGQVDFRIDSDGFIYTQVGNAGFVQGARWLESGANTDFEVRVTKVTGTNLTGDSLATWLATTSDRTWTHLRASPGTTQSTNTVEIRDKVTQVVLDSTDAGGLSMSATLV